MISKFPKIVLIMLSLNNPITPKLVNAQSTNWISHPYCQSHSQSTLSSNSLAFLDAMLKRDQKEAEIKKQINNNYVSNRLNFSTKLSAEHRIDLPAVDRAYYDLKRTGKNFSAIANEFLKPTRMTVDFELDKGMTWTILEKKATTYSNPFNLYNLFNLENPFCGFNKRVKGEATYTGEESGLRLTATLDTQF